MTTLKAVLVDDEILLLDLLGRIVNGTDGIEVIAAFADPEQALQEIPRLRPDVLFLDVDMPELNGIELATRLLADCGADGMAIVFVTAYEQYAVRAFQLNAVHYILKPAEPSSVEEIVRRIGQRRGNQEERPIGVNLELVLFGSMHLRVNGRKVDFLTAKLEELLALLIIHRDKGISKWIIADILWETSSLEKSMQNLYTMIFRLKAMLRDVGIDADIHNKNGVYQIHLADVNCDIVAFDRFAKRGAAIDDSNAAEFERAVELYQGELLEGRDYLWCISHREKYYQQFAELVGTLAAWYAGRSDTERLSRLRRRVKPLLIEEDCGDLLR